VNPIALDTNAYRAIEDGNQQLAARLRASSSIGLPVIVLGELWAGFFGGSKVEENTARLQRFLSTPRVELLDITDETARLFGEIAATLRQVGKPIQQNDIWIAALCKQYGYVLATADVGFRNITGLEIFTF
jgi:tRNA(fMet)-specific endonuclease VapC